MPSIGALYASLGNFLCDDAYYHTSNSMDDPIGDHHYSLEDSFLRRDDTVS